MGGGSPPGWTPTHCSLVGWGRLDPLHYQTQKHRQHLPLCWVEETRSELHFQNVATHNNNCANTACVIHHCNTHVIHHCNTVCDTPLQHSTWYTTVTQYVIHHFIVYWTLTSNTNIWAFTKTNALDISPYQSCLSRAKPISVVFITREIHISRVSLYDKFLIIRFERNTIETSLVHCLWHCLLSVLSAIPGSSLLVLFTSV